METVVTKTTTVKKGSAKKPAQPEVNGITEDIISRYFDIDQQHKYLDKERKELGDLIKKAWPDNEMRILGHFSVEKKVTEARIMDKDILYKLLSERIGKEEADEMFELSKAASARVALTVKKAAA